MIFASIDKHRIIRSGLSVFLNGRFCDVEMLEADCIYSFQKKYTNDSADVIIIGLAEEAEGIDLIVLKQMILANPRAVFVIYAGKPQYDLAISCMRIGVKGYLLKSNGLDELFLCMDRVINGGHYLCNEFANLAAQDILLKTSTDFPRY